MSSSVIISSYEKLDEDSRYIKYIRTKFPKLFRTYDEPTEPLDRLLGLLKKEGIT